MAHTLLEEADVLASDFHASPHGSCAIQLFPARQFAREVSYLIREHLIMRSSACIASRVTSRIIA